MVTTHPNIKNDLVLEPLAKADPHRAQQLYDLTDSMWGLSLYGSYDAKCAVRFNKSFLNQIFHTTRSYGMSPQHGKTMMHLKEWKARIHLSDALASCNATPNVFVTNPPVKALHITQVSKHDPLVTPYKPIFMQELPTYIVHAKGGVTIQDMLMVAQRAERTKPGYGKDFGRLLGNTTLTEIHIWLLGVEVDDEEC